MSVPAIRVPPFMAKQLTFHLNADVFYMLF